MFWKWIWKRYWGACPLWGYYVSILIVLEVNLEALASSSRTINLVEFQSLLFWKWIWKKQWGEWQDGSNYRFNPYCSGSESGRLLANTSACSEKGVSILIVLEVNLEVMIIESTPLLEVSFNPYCSGSESGSGFTFLALDFSFLFQSLLFWKWIWKLSFK